MTDHTREHLIELLRRFDTAMLVTRSAEGELRSRPMMIVERDLEGCLWLATSLDSPKVHEIEQDPRVNLALQAERSFVSIEGTASVVRDHAAVDAMWKTSWRVWFPKGGSDPDLGLLRVTMEVAEYWDLGGANGIRFLLDAARSYLKNAPPAPSGDLHGKVYGA